MRVLSLFSGGGLGDYGLELAGMEIVGQVEIDDYCQKILALRWPDVPKFRDIRHVQAYGVLSVMGRPDLISGGFPCQPFSTAGNRAGAKDERNLWPEMHRIICEIKPRWVLAENVPGLLSIDDGRVFGGILRDLAESGYVVEWDCIPASAIGAPHRRDRIFIVAYSSFGRRQNNKLRTRWEKFRRRSQKISNTNGFNAKLCKQNIRKKNQKKRKVSCGYSSISTNASSKGLEGNEPKIFSREQNGLFAKCDWWKTEPGMGRMVDGCPNQVDRLKLLGNGQVVQVVEWIGKQIMEFEKSAKEI